MKTEYETKVNSKIAEAQKLAKPYEQAQKAYNEKRAAVNACLFSWFGYFMNELCKDFRHNYNIGRKLPSYADKVTLK